ncbi:hypothetical protein DERP_001536 [Dermatophagoides pteronyssinus]|uniref:Uncharacterized protein n=1 Tax=Dermatophagoides pteronyssinus TaxID=6956 RepID=A0ABQ8JAU2_DERPT|nr:hypothetical protein DERP_001536 [Dermatophagoides pteronyssinus]
MAGNKSTRQNLHHRIDQDFRHHHPMAALHHPVFILIAIFRSSALKKLINYLNNEQLSPKKNKNKNLSLNGNKIEYKKKSLNKTPIKQT